MNRRNLPSKRVRRSLGWHWWQVDRGWYLIYAMEALGLASNVQRPEPN